MTPARRWMGRWAPATPPPSARQPEERSAATAPPASESAASVRTEKPVSDGNPRLDAHPPYRPDICHSVRLLWSCGIEIPSIRLFIISYYYVFVSGLQYFRSAGGGQLSVCSPSFTIREIRISPRGGRALLLHARLTNESKTGKRRNIHSWRAADWSVSIGCKPNWVLNKVPRWGHHYCTTCWTKPVDKQLKFGHWYIWNWPEVWNKTKSTNFGKYFPAHSTFLRCTRAALSPSLGWGSSLTRRLGHVPPRHLPGRQTLQQGKTKTFFLACTRKQVLIHTCISSFCMHVA